MQLKLHPFFYKLLTKAFGDNIDQIAMQETITNSSRRIRFDLYLI